MGLYKVMLVDDEEEVRQAIEKRINWEEIGFEVVAGAENGEDALEKAEIFVPDVIMTDIHMPFIDGLTFAKMIKKSQPATKIVIFSGYDEFEYAKEAIRLEAEEYILKPIDSEELKKVFLRIKERLDDEIDKRRNEERLRKYYEDSLPLLKEQLLIGILEGRINKSSIEEYSAEYGLSMESPFYAVAVMEPAGSDRNKNSQVISVSLKQLAEENLPEYMNCRVINYLGSIIVIALLNKTDEHGHFLGVIYRICKLASRMLDAAVSAGVSRVAGNITDISIAYKEAQDALSYRVMLEDNQAIYIKDVEPEINDTRGLDESYIERIIKSIKIGSREELEEAIGELISFVIKSAPKLANLRIYLIHLYINLVKLASSYELEASQLSTIERDILEEIYAINSPDEMREWIDNICMQIRGYIRKERLDSTKLMVEKAREYIKDNFSNPDVSVDTLCNYLGVSPTYFSSIFKKDTGVSFVTYLTNVRMEAAVRLIESTAEKSYVIAEMVGYEDPNYFSYVFKKAYGISPSKYRNRQDNNI